MTGQRGILKSMAEEEKTGVPDVEPKREEYPWKRAKKVAAMLSFSGTY